MEKYLTEERIIGFIDGAFSEDIGSGDHSTLASISKEKKGRSRLLVKADGILAGVELAKRIFSRFDPEIQIEVFLNDGQKVKKGDVAFEVYGYERSLLSCERLVLNCMQRMSGIATYTRSLQEMISHTDAMILDTRKTTPNFRIAEKWAVKIGGGENHRFALYDMVMLKDNHIDFCGGITKALKRTKEYLDEAKLDLKIEVETRTLAEVKEVISSGMADRVMLDNMSPEDMKSCVELTHGKIETEASGGITEKNIKEVAETGVDFISIGALTHSYKSLDLSLKAVKE